MAIRKRKVKNTTGKSRALIFAESPLQILCAYEAIVFFNLDYTLILRLSGEERNDGQMLYTAKRLGLVYYSVKVKPGQVVGGLLKNIIFLSRLLINKYEFFISGSYFSKFITVLAQIKLKIRKAEVIYLDDGVATYLAQKRMRRLNSDSTIFTFLEVEPLSGQQVFRHKFEMLQSLFGPQEVKGSYFIGQKLIEAGFCDQKTYLSILEKLISCYGELIYIPHRAESVENLQAITGLEGIEIVFSETCMELYFLDKKTRPENIFSFFSTALFTMPKIYTELNCYSITSESINLQKIEHAPEILEALSAVSSVEIIKF